MPEGHWGDILWVVNNREIWHCFAVAMSTIDEWDGLSHETVCRLQSDLLPDAHMRRLSL